MATVFGGHAEVVKFLINRKANVNLALLCGGTALHYACVKRNIPMMELLMSEGAQRDVRDRNGQTPLHSTASLGHQEAVACLLDRGDDINAADNMSATPLDDVSCHRPPRDCQSLGPQGS